MKKIIYTLNINNYAPELRALTRPHLEFYAKRIGAEIIDITERKYPHMPVVYEKLQIYDLAQKYRADWNIYIDSDCLIHPETIDFTNFLDKSTVFQVGSDMAAIRWRYDKYFLRDGRNIGTCNWFTIFSDWCIDLYKPLEDMELDEVMQYMYPTVIERTTVVDTAHLIDDFVLSRNVARYGLKYQNLKELLEKIGLPNANFFWHEYLITTQEKVAKAKEVIKLWKIN
jgi:hypothetical protein